MSWWLKDAETSAWAQSNPRRLGSLLTFISVFSLDGSGGNQLAGGEVIEGAEAASEFVGAQAAVAVESERTNSSAWRSAFSELQSRQQETRFR
jgi:hypothetical protein